MNSVVVSFLWFLVAISLSLQYTTKYDNLNYEDILRSDRLLKNYVNCLLGKGNCTPEGAELKKDLPDALQTECSQCSEAQKEGTRKVIKFLIENKRDVFDQLQAKYDPDGTYLKRYREVMLKEGIVLD